MKPRLHNVITACLLLVAIGGHLAILQSVAWMGMLVSFSQKEGFAAAVEKTFDGKHPCKLCKAVDHAKQKSTSGKTLIKSEFGIAWMLVELDQLLWLPKPERIFLSSDEIALLSFGTPSIPPPKFS